MMKSLLITLFLCMFSQISMAQNYHPGDENLLASGLPLVVIETEGGVEPTFDVIQAPPGCMGIGITNKTKVPSRMTITKAGNLLYDSGNYEKGVSGLTLSIRGNTSAAVASKKPYKIKLQKKADLLFRGDKSYNDKDWCLLKCERRAFLNNLVGFKVNEMAGLQWTPRFMYVNVVINGDYKGAYMLTETVNNSGTRLSVEKNNGYIIEYDAYWWNEDLSLAEGQFYIWNSMRYTFKYPDPDDITRSQIDFIQGRVEEMENSIKAGNYEQYIDVSSFASWLVAHDILGDIDACGSNIYLTLYDRDPETKFKMGNIWDMDVIELKKDDWAPIHYIYGFYFEWLFRSENKLFTETYKSKWNELSPVLVDEISRYLDDFSTSEEGLGVDLCMQYDAMRWHYTPSTLSEEIEKNKQWFTNRKAWLDENTVDIKTPWVTYKATFENTDNWEEVHAYLWYDDGISIQTPHGEWPGLALKKNKETGLYQLSVLATRKPEKIIFNNGCTKDSSVVGINTTETFDYEMNKAYFGNAPSSFNNIQRGNQSDPIIYNLMGQRVKNAAKGLYIINGKVVFVK